MEEIDREIIKTCSNTKSDHPPSYLNVNIKEILLGGTCRKRTCKGNYFTSFFFHFTLKVWMKQGKDSQQCFPQVTKASTPLKLYSLERQCL